MNDTDIIALLFKRDESALSVIETKYGGILKSIARNISGSAEDAEECLNDMSLGVWNSVPPKRPDSLLAYCAALIRRSAVDMLRKRNAGKRGGGKYDLSLSELDEILGACDDENTDEISAVLNEFLSSLERQNRMIFVRRYFCSESIEDIAACFGKSENGVSVALFRMRKKLRAALKERGLWK